MGQTNSNKYNQESHELQPLDKINGIYINIRNNKLYAKNYLVVASADELEYEL